MPPRPYFFESGRQPECALTRPIRSSDYRRRIGGVSRITITALIAGMGPNQGIVVLAQPFKGSVWHVHPVAAVRPRATSNIRAHRGRVHLALVLSISVDRLTPKVPCLCDPALRRVCLFRLTLRTRHASDRMIT